MDEQQQRMMNFLRGGLAAPPPPPGAADNLSALLRPIPGLPPLPNGPNGGFLLPMPGLGIPDGDAPDGGDDLMGRVAHFLPQIQAANAALLDRLRPDGGFDMADDGPDRLLHLPPLVRPIHNPAAAMAMDRNLHLVVDSEDGDSDGENEENEEGSDFENNEDEEDDNEDEDDENDEEDERPPKQRKLAHIPTVVLDLQLTSADNPLFQTLLHTETVEDGKPSGAASAPESNNSQSLLLQGPNGMSFAAIPKPQAKGPLITEMDETHTSCE